MPGFELIGPEELQELTELFTKANGVLFRHGFDGIRNGVFKVRSFEREFANYLQVNHALAVSSGTAALKVALEAIGVGPGDEVITQAFTFVATAEAIIECGAVPVICDIDESLNLDPQALAKVITGKTKAVIAVHMLGVPADLDSILAICRPRGVKVIEDTAWGLGGAYKGRKLGTIGDAGTYSFDYAKAITTGEGGMVVTNNPEIDFRARAYHDHGHENNPNVQRWEDTRHASGFNYRMSELQGAIGLAQLRKLDSIIEKQRELKAKLEECAFSFPFIKPRKVPDGSHETGDAFVFLVDSKERALACRRALIKEGLGTKILPEAVTWHFAKTWSHMSSLVERSGGDLTVTLKDSEALLTRSVAIPINLKMDATYLDKLQKALASLAKDIS
jgi:8-amino-3,8-dideoxy-alpha-D-manno-octulosonate transaminase